ncbi:MAG: pilC [Frankiales bacterium]|nr:pilC [Frankiales bacterium]
MTTLVDIPPDTDTDAPASGRGSIWQFELTPKKVPRKDLMHFSRQLAVFIKAGIPILEALEVIREELPNKHFLSILDALVDDLQGGATFADALSAHEDAFPAYYVGILRSAELTGHLDDVLLQLSEYIERDVEARRKVVSALTYPAVIAVMSVVVVVVLTVYVMPKFQVFFEGLHAKLPAPTRALLAISSILTTYWFVFVGAGVLIAATLVISIRSTSGRYHRDRILLRLPVIGELVRFAALERFCRILSSMTAAGVPLPDALRVTADAISNEVFRRGLMSAREAMMRGEGLAQPLAETELFPAAARQMMRVGEATGTLDAQLETAAAYFDRELDFKIKRFTDLFEPAVLLTMGLVVGFVAIALVSAMYGIFRQVGVQ